MVEGKKDVRTNLIKRADIFKFIVQKIGSSV